MSTGLLRMLNTLWSESGNSNHYITCIYTDYNMCRLLLGCCCSALCAHCICSAAAETNLRASSTLRRLSNRSVDVILISKLRLPRSALGHICQHNSTDAALDWMGDRRAETVVEYIRQYKQLWECDRAVFTKLCSRFVLFVKGVADMTECDCFWQVAYNLVVHTK
jgi:hypothetical protein